MDYFKCCPLKDLQSFISFQSQSVTEALIVKQHNFRWRDASSLVFKQEFGHVNITGVIPCWSLLPERLESPVTTMPFSTLDHYRGDFPAVQSRHVTLGERLIQLGDFE